MLPRKCPTNVVHFPCEQQRRRYRKDIIAQRSAARSGAAPFAHWFAERSGAAPFYPWPTESSGIAFFTLICRTQRRCASRPLVRRKERLALRTLVCRKQRRCALLALVCRKQHHKHTAAPNASLKYLQRCIREKLKLRIWQINDQDYWN